MRVHTRLGWVTVASVIVAASAAYFQGCGGDSKPSSGPPDSGTTSDSGASTDGSTGDDGSTSTDAASEAATDAAAETTADAAGLSARAAAGIAASPFTVDTSTMSAAQAEQVGMGSYIVNVVASCPDCHNKPGGTGATGYLAGGTAFGPVHARNLTSDATNGLRMTEAQFIETLQTGKDQKLSGKVDGGGDVALIVMPWEDFRWMSVTDLKAVYAYLKLVPADTNADSFGPPGGPPIPMPTTFTDGAATTPPTLPSETGDAPLFAARGRAVQALVEPSAVGSLSAADLASYGRGAYLVNAQAICGDCHTNPERTSRTSTKLNTAQFLTGGRVFAVPPGLDALTHTERTMTANLLGATHGFIFQSTMTEKIFSDTISKHVHADETPPTRPLGFPMPQAFKNFVAEDVHALWTYLSHQTPVSGTDDKATQDSAGYCSTTVSCAGTATCNTATNECVASSGCTKDADCAACQTCDTTSGACKPPVTTGDAGVSTCVTAGI